MVSPKIRLILRCIELGRVVEPARGLEHIHGVDIV
jgi:hypothetical protein